MMLLSRFWYGILGLLIAFALYLAYVGVGQYNRAAQLSMAEGVASDSQVVRWALQIDARRRLDALLVGSVDKSLQDALSASAKDRVPPKARDDAKKALEAISQKLPVEVRPSSIFAVDRDGRVVASLGFDAVGDDFELGGYPAVYDALHGYLRDDTWVLGGRMFRVVARPVEVDVSQPPVGAIVGFKAVDDPFAKDLAKLTRANVMFFAGGVKVALAFDNNEVPDKFLGEFLGEMGKLDGDKAYKEGGRSALRMLANEDVGAIFARLDGDAWDLRGGYAVARARKAIQGGPLGFLSSADDKDKKSNISWFPIVTIALLAILIGLAFSFLEHTMPMKDLAKQAIGLRKGEFDLLQLPRLRGGYRNIGEELNAGIQRVAEKGGGAIRKEADLESILGPTPAQPAMSAFSFPMAGDAPPGSASRPGGALPPASSSGRGLTGGNGPAGGPPPPSSNALMGGPAPAGGAPKGPPAKPPKPPPPRSAPGLTPTAFEVGAGGAGAAGAAAVAAAAPPPAAAVVAAAAVPAAASSVKNNFDSGEHTTVEAPHRDLLAKATGSSSGMMKAAEEQAAGGDEGAEWLAVYEEFLRTKKQCGEPTDGLTFEKFRQTLRKNRDALIQRHGCKRVKFSVYVKEGRASLKATPVKE